MLKDALAVATLDFTDDQRQQMLTGVNQNLTRYLRQIAIDPNIAPPLYYSPLVPGTRLDRAVKPLRARRRRRCTARPASRTSRSGRSRTSRSCSRRAR